MLKPLPAAHFVYAEWTRAKVNVDYHVEIEGHYYSVPHAHLHEHVDVRFSEGTVEVLLDGRRVASHARSFQRGRHTTTAEHMPVAHRAHLEWSPSRIINWAGTIGPARGTATRASKLRVRGRWRRARARIATSTRS